MISFLDGETVRLTFTTKVDGTLTDPAAATLTVTPPTGPAVALSWPAGGLTRLGAGQFRALVVGTPAGRWVWEIDTTGAAAGASQGTFIVKPRKA